MLTPEFVTKHCTAAAERVSKSLASKTFDLRMPGIRKEDARGTNSEDRSFIDKLLALDHLK